MILQEISLDITTHIRLALIFRKSGFVSFRMICRAIGKSDDVDNSA
jgi:hypothetical protein